MARPSYPSDNVDKLLLRFPEGMREQLKSAAEANGRSMNSEIITRLEASLSGATGASTGGDAIDQIFTNTMQKIMEGPILPTDRQMRELVAEYEAYKIDQIHKLREFLDIVRDVLADSQGKPRLTLEQDLQRGAENEFARLRAWANAWGYDVVKMDGEIEAEDDEISLGIAPYISPGREKS